MKRRGYDGVVLCAPVSVPYRRYSVNSAHWWIGRALHALTQRTGVKPTELDGLSVSSFTLAPDTAIGLTQHLGLSPRWLDHVPLGGASAGVAVRRAARAVQMGDADLLRVSVPIRITLIVSARRCLLFPVSRRTRSIRTAPAARMPASR